MTVKSRATINSEADAVINDNAVGDVTPAEVRQRIKDLADSSYFPGDNIAIADLPDLNAGEFYGRTSGSGAPAIITKADVETLLGIPGLLSDISLLALMQADDYNDRLDYDGMIADAFDDESDIQLGIDGYTKALFHFDGTNASTTITDSSGTSKTPSCVGNAQLDTSVKKFGTAMLKLDGTGDWVALGTHADYNDLGVNAEPFTIDFWMRRNGDTEYSIFSSGGGTGAWNSTNGHHLTLVSTGGTFYVQWNLGAGGNGSITTSNPTDLTLTHVEVAYDGTNIRLFFNGTQVGSTVALAGIFSGSSARSAYIGCMADNTYPYNGWVDEFRVSRGIARHVANFEAPTAPYESFGSQNHLYNSASDWYYPSTAAATNQITAHSGSNTSASGTISADTNNSTAFNAVDGSDSTAPAYWINSGGATGKLTYQFGAGKKIGSYRITAGIPSFPRYPTDWTLKGSNTGSFTGEETTLDTRTGQSFGTLEVRSFTVTTPQTFTYYRLDVTNCASGANLSIVEWRLLSAPAPDDMTITSRAFTALSAPARGRLSVQAILGEAITINTDLKGWISRDDGATWTQVTLALKSDGAVFKFYGSAMTTFSGSSGVALRYKITTHNAKDIKISGVTYKWE